ncbi:adenylate kinase 7 [Echinococcus multilocularis]|uniref:Adenylate kinase 7 n=1 Tax=Echinococcus multilocularis TaxID=6211 RepID=A0A068Y6W4_ECHMU|nr:adenylate kinase 7 [Echinococcus multilocularis]
MEEDIGEEGLDILPRVFVNNLDSYVSNTLAQHLASCKPGHALVEEDEVEEEEEERIMEPDPPKKPQLTGYRIVGTISHPKAHIPTFVESALNYESRRDFYEHLFECDCVIYDITSDVSQAEEALWVAKSLANDYQRIRKKKIFIVVTHLLSWLCSKTGVSEGNHPTYDEEDHAKRIPHPLYKRQFAAERAIFNLGRKHRKRLTTYVVGCGIPYGGSENIFEPFFLKAWMNSRVLEVYGNGENIIPTIHIKDLSTIVQAIFEEPPKSRYIVARDHSESTLGEIITAISKVFGTGEIRHLSDNELIRITQIPRVHIDQLTMDMIINTPTLDEELTIPWRCEGGIIDNIEKLAQEYVKAKDFKPLRICILGPPFVGKTTHAIALARHYGLHYIHVTPVLYEAYILLRTPIKALEQLRHAQELEKKAKLLKAREEKPRQPPPPPLLATATSQDVPDDQLSTATLPPSDEVLPTDVVEPTLSHSLPPNTPITEASEAPQEETSVPSEASLIDSLPEEVQRRYPFYPPLKWANEWELEEMAKKAGEELREFVDGMIDDFHANDHIVTKYLRRKLLSKPCRNQGFVLDSYPNTFNQADALFTDPDDTAKDPRHPTCDPLVSPHHVIYLEGSNALVTHRYRTMLEEEGIALNGIDDYADPDGTTLNIEEEVNRRRLAQETEKLGIKIGIGGEKNEGQKKDVDLRIKWVKPLETPERRLRRRLEYHRSVMAPKAAREIVEKIFEPYKYLVSEKESEPLDAQHWPRKPLAKAKLNPLEINVLTYFDLRELYPFTVSMDRDKSQHLYPGGPQKHTFKQLVKRISKSSTGEFVRRTRGLLDERDGDEKFVKALQQEAEDLNGVNANLRKEAAEVLNENERKIWHDWLMLLRKENEERQMVKSMPRRNYLLKYVLPKVSECLVIYGQRRPADPIDFLAEYILRDAGVNYSGIIR